jgi:hypothetical protein
VDGEKVRGIGVATDVIVASVEAYLGALNRLIILRDRKGAVPVETKEP